MEIVDKPIYDINLLGAISEIDLAPDQTGQITITQKTLTDPCAGTETYRFAFAYWVISDTMADTFQVLTKYYDVDNALMGTVTQDFPFSAGPRRGEMVLSPPIGAKKLIFYFNITTGATYTFNYFALNEQVNLDRYVLTEDSLPYGFDRIMKCYTDFYATDKNASLVTVNNALAAEIDMVMQLTRTMMNTFFLSYANEERLDSYGLLFDLPRDLGEYDGSYRIRLQNVLTGALGGGTTETIKKIVMNYTRGPKPIVREVWVPGSGVEVLIPLNTQIFLTDEQLIYILKQVVVVGTYITIISEGPMEYDQGYGLDIDEWV